MDNDKVKYLIDIINDMAIKDKLRLAIRVNETVYTNIDYDKKEMFENFETRLKELDNEYGKYLRINPYILMITVKIKGHNYESVVTWYESLGILKVTT